MKTSMLMLGMSLLLSVPAFAQDDLVPATSDDIQKFDDSVDSSSTDGSTTTATKEKKDNFGKSVSAEAKKLKDLPKEDRQKMGQWVSGQRRKDGDKKVHGASGNSSAAGNSTTMGGSADARVSAPTHGSGNAAAPGQNANSNHGRPSNRGR